MVFAIPLCMFTAIAISENEAGQGMNCIFSCIETFQYRPFRNNHISKIEVRESSSSFVIF